MMDLAYNENAVRTCERTAIFIGDDPMNIFEEVKVAVNISTVTKYYGLTLNAFGTLPNTYKTCITHRL